MGGLYGTTVVARPDGRLTEVDGIGGFGYRHRWLRDLGDGWQMLETTGWNDPPDLRVPSRAVADAIGGPVFAAYVNDGYCAAMCASLPGRTGELTHLWSVERTCGVFAHTRDGLSDAAGRPADEVVEELRAWSAAAGLSVDLTAIRESIALTGVDVDERLVELVTALGVARIGRTLPYSFDLESDPFSLVTYAYSGLGQRARVETGLPKEPWEAAAIALETELWTAVHRPDQDVAALVRRVIELRDQWRGRVPETTDAFLDSCFPIPADGSWSPDDPDQPARRYADSRATV